MKLEKTEQASTYFEQSIVISRILGDLDAEGRNLSYLGKVMTALGEYDAAISTYQNRIAIARKIGDERGETIGSWNLGELLIKQKKYKDGLAYLWKCVDYERKVGDPAWLADEEIVKQIESRYGGRDE